MRIMPRLKLPGLGSAPSFVHRQSETAGRPPGELVHVGDLRSETTRISVVRYSASGATETEITDLAQLPQPDGEAEVLWVSVHGLHDIDKIEQLGRAYGLHSLILEDILNTEQRPKYEDLGEYVFMVLKTTTYSPEDNTLDTDHVSIVLGKGLVICFQEEDNPEDANLFAALRQRIMEEDGRIRSAGADYLAYRLVDTIIDSYFLVLEYMEDSLEAMEDSVVTDPGPSALKSIQLLKRHLIALRKSVWPLREVIGRMQRRESPLIGDETAAFLRDVYDHTIQVIDTVETFRDVASSLMDIYLSSVSNRLNEVMKVLTIIATIFMPISFIAGFYGMNFENIPELKQPWGYPAAVIVMLGVSVAMVAYFRRKRWL